MNYAFPKASVKEYEYLIEQIELPDKDDRHVLATAIKSVSSGIITFNLKDFPVNRLRDDYQIEVIHPDQFILKLAERGQASVQQAFENQLRSLRNPPMPKEGLLQILRNCGLSEALEILE